MLTTANQSSHIRFYKHIYIEDIQSIYNQMKKTLSTELMLRIETEDTLYSFKTWEDLESNLDQLIEKITQIRINVEPWESDNFSFTIGEFLLSTHYYKSINTESILQKQIEKLTKHITCSVLHPSVYIPNTRIRLRNRPTNRIFTWENTAKVMATVIAAIMTSIYFGLWEFIKQYLTRN